jgi:hypothetical protein
MVHRCGAEPQRYFGLLTGTGRNQDTPAFRFGVGERLIVESLYPSLLK